MKKRSNPPIGIIAEDESDVSSIRILIHRISGNNKIGTKQFIGDGCGKIIKKCNAWSNQLMQSGCETLILVHDLDRKQYNELNSNLTQALTPCAIEKHIICIPTEEIEAWILSDVEAIKKGMNLKAAPKIIHHPERVSSPKEVIEHLVRKISNGEKSYTNTIHNEKIMPYMSISNMKLRCPSFVPFHDFIIEHFTVKKKTKKMVKKKKRRVI